MKRIDLVCGLLVVSVLLAVAGPSLAKGFSAADVYRDASPSVVLIFGFNKRGEGNAGTGSILSRDGLILTNSHVVLDPKTHSPYSDLKVYFKPARITGDSRQDLKNGQVARVVAIDKTLDLALLRVGSIPQNAPPVSFGDSERTPVGTSVAAIGHPGGGGLWTLTTGTISSIRREGRRDVFQTDAAINPGNSGGPLLDADARLIGINTFVRRVNAQGLPLEGLAYSLRSSTARDWLSGQGVEVGVGLPRKSAPAAPSPADTSVASNPPPKATPRRETPREYKSADGQRRFGVPNPDFDLDGTKDELISKLKKKAQSAFDELDADDDDDFFGEDF